MSEICFACERSNKETKARRAKCTTRQSHRPQGEYILHEGRTMKWCTDCATLVVPV